MKDIYNLAQGIKDHYLLIYDTMDEANQNIIIYNEAKVSNQAISMHEKQDNLRNQAASQETI